GQLPRNRAAKATWSTQYAAGQLQRLKGLASRNLKARARNSSNDLMFDSSTLVAPSAPIALDNPDPIFQIPTVETPFQNRSPTCESQQFSDSNQPTKCR